ncbi:MAG: recombinase family protein [Ruminococcaceae bacterium]|nr:recombinase family protein [Oscillospiraceae bacterium]
MNKLRVAAYCRVSTNHEEQESSLETQISYYGKFIAEHKDWQLVKIYTEQASGTQIKKRLEFMKMIKACRQGKIDLIITKSISRFGRNTLEILKIVYELFNLDVKVYFEKENLNNYNKEMRTMMGVYGGFAQEESKSMSDNIKWGIRERMREGKVCLNCTRFLGFDKDENGNLVVVESEAVIVRKIFELYLNGWGVRKIKRYLEGNEIKTVTGKDVWSTSTIDRILSNEKYVGDVLMQKSFTEDFLTGKRKKNEGELNMYLIKDNHTAIISREVFDNIQKRKAKRD